MFGPRFRAGMLVAGLAAAFATAGCIQNFKLPGIPTAGELEAAERKEERERERYKTTKDSKAIRWLLANRLKQGMPLAQVNETLGEDGERVYNDAHYKERNEGTRLTDESYKWGPDADSHSYVLFFRNERLVRFDPKEYR